MRTIHGDLLMGGVAIREIDGIVDDVTDDCGGHQEGKFEVEAQKQSILELGRPYLLLLDDGGTIELVVKEIDQTSDPGRFVVQFESTS
jgi:hypothetical protein